MGCTFLCSPPYHAREKVLSFLVLIWKLGNLSRRKYQQWQLNHTRKRVLFARLYITLRSWDGFDTPPPFATDIAISELRRARIKQQTSEPSANLFVVPKLCAPLWIKQVYKAADLVFEIPAGQPFWDKSMRKPLHIAIVLPFIRSKPWQLCATPKMYSMGSELRKMFKIEGLDSWDLLCKFWEQCHRLRIMPEDVVRKVLNFGPANK